MVVLRRAAILESDLQSVPISLSNGGAYLYEGIESFY